MNFHLARHSNSTATNSTFVLPHRPVPEIPKEKVQSADNHQQETGNIYLTAMSIPQSPIKEEDHTSVKDRVRINESLLNNFCIFCSC